MKLSIHYIKYTITLFIFCFYFLNLFAFNFDINDLDSLKRVSSKSTGTVKIECLNNISQLFWNYNIDSSFYYAKLALNLAEKINDQEGIAFAQNNLGGAYFYLGDYLNAIKHCNISLELRRKLGLKKSEEAVLGNLSTIYVQMGIYDKALEYNFQSLKISEEIGDSFGIASAYLVNAFIYNEQGMIEKSLSLNMKALAIFLKLNQLRFASATMNNLGSGYDQLGKDQIAAYYFKEALKIAQSINDLYSCANVIDNIGRGFSMRGKYDSAIIYYHKAINMLDRLQSQDVSSSYISLSHVFLKMNNLDSAKYYLDKSYSISVKTKQLNRMSSIYELYTQFYEKTNNPAKALKYYRLFIQIRDSIQSEKNRNKLLDMQIDYETDKLKAEKRMQALNAKKNRIQRDFSIAFSILFLLLAIAIFNRFLIKKKSNIALEKANSTKDKFFTIIAHDLKNQLTAFQSISQVLAENFLHIAEEKRHHLIIRINTAAITLYEVLENLLTWSSAQLKGIECEPKQLNLNELAKHILNELKLQADKKEILLINEIPEDTTVWADENMIMHIIRNLVNNAIKFSPINNSVRIQSNLNKNMVEVSVIDQGIGISSIDLNKLFRLDISNKEIGKHIEKGSGLGLIISKEFVEKMGGKIWADSQEGKGSIFTFSLPLNC
jgi:signal transduction histidine kinase